jgi:amino acid adenylation domain-containing protein
VAVEFGGRTLTYGELFGRAGCVARELARNGVGPDVLVALYVERSLEMAVAMVGIFQAGGAYVPLDPAHPPARLSFMLEDSGAPVVLTQRHLGGTLPPHRSRVVFVEDAVADTGSAPGAPTASPRAGSGPQHLAYVIYTSGSTGTPKGVMMEHRSLSNVAEAMRDMLGLSQADVVLAVSTISFDIACLDVFLPLMLGGRVVILSAEEAMFGGIIAGALRSSHATVIQATPATLRMLVESSWPGSSRLHVVSTGEALPTDLADALLARGARVWNAYSATEGGVYATMHDVQLGESPVPVGLPIPNVAVYVLGQDGSPAPPGVTGEIHVGGVGPGRGYLNRPGLTRERFVPDPFSAVPGARLYRMGDLGRFRPDGVLEYLGRTDHQVKVRGFRVELGEVEAVLASHADVREAVVVAREDEPGDRRLVGYVVAEEGSKPEPMALRRFLKDRLPSYMVPSTVVVMDAFPLTPTRKVDRLALPPP